MMGILDWIFGCPHSDYSWPQRRGRDITVSCLQCGAFMKYEWRQMKIVPWPKEEPVKQQQINPVLEIQRGNLEGRLR